MKKSSKQRIAFLFVGILMSLIYCSINVSQCVSTESSTNNIIRGTYSTSLPSTDLQFMTVLTGKVYGYEYYFGQSNLGANTYITKRTSDFQSQWDKTISSGFSSYAPIVNNQETKLYFLINDKISIVEMDTSNGSISSTHKSTDFEYYQDF